MPPPPTWLPQELIARKRDGGALSADQWTYFVRGLVDGSITEGQVAALGMAVHFRGMDMDECVALTRAMTESGDRLSWKDEEGGPVLDKHSTGGIGDKVSLVLAPILAACGARVPMISGRGLGHTGGTLDKLESIPGYDTTPSLVVFRRAVREAGCAIVGQTGRLAPADDRFYAIRDVTATVDPIPLITASILSKKLAAGLDALVMDVKVGTGAFSRDRDEARALAESLVTVATGAGLPTRALVTDQNEVLGRTAGNAVEVREAVALLTRTADLPRFEALVRALCANLLVMGGLEPDGGAAAARVTRALDDGSAAERFARMVAALSGDADVLEHPDRVLPAAPCVRPLLPSRAGTVRRIDGRRIGMTIVEMGGGRRRADDTIDPAVGLSAVLGLGERTGPDRPLALVHARSESQFLEAARAFDAAFEVGDEPLEPGPVVLETIGAPS